MKKREIHLFEELCAKGKAYRKKRMAAGEKSSAYLSGRAVKVCKGQIKGEAEDAAMKKSALGMAMYGKKAKMNEETGEVNVPNPSSFVDAFNFSGSQGGLAF